MPGLCVCGKRGQFGITIKDRHGYLPPIADRVIVWRCKEHRMTDVIDQQELAQYQAKAIADMLPGFSSWLNKHGLMTVAPANMTYDQITNMLGKAMQMYERELGKIIDSNGPNPVDGEVPFR